MSKELKAGVEVFDGKEVVSYAGRFSGAFDVDVEKGAQMANDDLYGFFVTARVADAKFSVGKTTGLLSRANTFTVEDVEVLDLDKAKWLYDQLGKVVTGVTEMIETKIPVVDENQESLFSLPVSPSTNGVNNKPMFLDVKLSSGVAS